MRSKRVSTFENMLDLYFDIDQETFDKVIIYPILKGFIEFIGDINQYDQEELLYQEFIYGKTLLFSENYEKTHDTDIMDVAGKILEDIYRVDKDFFYPISYSKTLGEREYELGIFGDTKNIVRLFPLLKNKTSTILKEYKIDNEYELINNSFSGEYKVLSYLDKNLSKKEIKSNFKLIEKSKALKFRTNNYYLDLESCKKYKKLIEIEIERKSNDDVIFNNL